MLHEYIFLMKLIWQLLQIIGNELLLMKSVEQHLSTIQILAGKHYEAKASNNMQNNIFITQWSDLDKCETFIFFKQITLLNFQKNVLLKHLPGLEVFKIIFIWNILLKLTA